MNRVCIIGNLTRDPELKTTQNGKSLCKFGIAYNERYGIEKQSHFFDVVAWDKTAEIVAERLRKGSKIALDGSLSYESWVDKNTQQKRNKVYITAKDVEFLSPRMDQEQNQE